MTTGKPYEDLSPPERRQMVHYLALEGRALSRAVPKLGRRFIERSLVSNFPDQKDFIALLMSELYVASS